MTKLISKIVDEESDDLAGEYWPDASTRDTAILYPKKTMVDDELKKIIIKLN